MQIPMILAQAIVTLSKNSQEYQRKTKYDTNSKKKIDGLIEQKVASDLQ